MSRDGYQILFTIPSSEHDFGLSGEHGILALGGGTQREGAWVCRELNLVRLSVELELPDAVLREDMDRATADEALRLLAAAGEAARRYLREYVDLIRTRHGQFWLAHSAQNPRLAWPTKVVSRATGERIRLGYGDPLKGVWHDSDEALSVDAHAEALREAELDELATVPELLLADAMYLAWTSDAPQYREAVLLAAVAAEVKIKETLDRVCAEAARPVLAFALSSHRGAPALYDKAAEAVTGRSYRKENPGLYQSLVRLFKDRNEVAHRANMVEPRQAKADLVAARDAIRWADGLLGRG